MEWISFVVGAASIVIAAGIALGVNHFALKRRRPGFAELLYNLRGNLLLETQQRRVLLDRKQSRAVLQATKLLSAARGIPPGKSFETYRDAFGRALFGFQKELSSSRPFLNGQTARACEQIESILVEMVSLSAEESRKMASELWARLTAARLRFDECVQAESEYDPLKNDAMRLIMVEERKNGKRRPVVKEAEIT